MKLALRYCMVIMLPAVAAAQPAPDGWVRLSAPAPGATLLAADSTLGAASAVHALPAGEHALTLRDGAAGAWAPRTATADVVVNAGDTLTVDLRLPFRYRVVTVPSGASVAVVTGNVREPLGLAPLTVDRTAPLGGELVATREGFAEARAAPGDSAVNRVTMILRPLSAAEGAAVDWRPPGRSRAWIDIAAGALALAAGAVAIHYKFQADAVDDRYRTPGSPERGDSALRAEAQRLDRISAGALGVMQLGLGVLAIRLVLR